MANISDIIENFILQTIGEHSSLDFSRNYLASHFDCSPSQINYVLTTRFTPARGFIIESQRGGGGYVRLIKLDFGKQKENVFKILSLITNEISFKESVNILNLLCDNGLISQNQVESYKVLLTDKALANPFKLEGALRANMLKEIVLNSLKEEQ
ncbi:MAG: CtsR family transcriptional regulator [Christensenellales bacterium]|jgi:transcriptional regulator CtsR